MKRVKLILHGTFLLLSGLTFMASLTACGVKADPQPPLTPLEIGHGRPVYKNDDDSAPLRQQPYQQYEDQRGQDDEEE